MICLLTIIYFPPFKVVADLMTPEQLVEYQNKDVTLSKLHSLAVNKEDIVKSPSYYYQGDVLMRFYRPPSLSAEDTWAVSHQVVLPVPLRDKVMEIAHDGYGGHLGIKKTYLKLLNSFYWPGLKQDVTKYVNSCHECQVAGKPNQSIPRYPLQPINVPSEPFSKIIVDCVGPLPKTKKGNQYLLTVMCPTTRYPEAFPLKNISAKTIANHLTHMFTTFGIPQEVQSDRGTNFTSDLFTQVLRELGIKQTLSSAYHPESQGALERWHQTLKTMLRKYCHENSESWDTGLDLLLFAIRESPHESLGLSPFQLLFGRQVRGPLTLVKEKLLNPSPDAGASVPVTTYLKSLQDKLSKLRIFAKQNLSKAQSKMEFYHNKKAQIREFKDGDKVLAYIPISGSPLSAKFHGPYEVKKKVNKTNYIIKTPDRRKSTQLIHINLLKAYVDKDPAGDSSVPCMSNNVVDKDVSDSGEIISPVHGLSNTEVLADLEGYLGHLSPDHKADVISLLDNYPAVLSDTPGQCTILEHDIELVPNTHPIRQAPYRLHPKKREQMKEEVDYLLQNGLAVPSCSPWASPCLLVPKEGGQLRLCTDYRKLNAVTIPDSYPIPRIDDLVDSVGQSKYLSKVDLVKGYYQIKLTEKAQIISAFITPFWIIQLSSHALWATK